MTALLGKILYDNGFKQKKVMCVLKIKPCLIANEATELKKRGCLSGRFIILRNVGKNHQILCNPLKFTFLIIFGCK